MTDFINANVPIANGVLKGKPGHQGTLYPWMVIKAGGGTSEFSSLTMRGDLLDENGLIVSGTDIPPVYLANHIVEPVFNPPYQLLLGGEPLQQGNMNVPLLQAWLNSNFSNGPIYKWYPQSFASTGASTRARYSVNMTMLFEGVGPITSGDYLSLDLVANIGGVDTPQTRASVPFPTTASPLSTQLTIQCVTNFLSTAPNGGTQDYLFFILSGFNSNPAARVNIQRFDFTMQSISGPFP